MFTFFPSFFFLWNIAFHVSCDNKSIILYSTLRLSVVAAVVLLTTDYFNLISNCLIILFKVCLKCCLNVYFCYSVVSFLRFVCLFFLCLGNLKSKATVYF